MEISRLGKQPNPKFSNATITGQGGIAVTDRGADGINS